MEGQKQLHRRSSAERRRSPARKGWGEEKAEGQKQLHRRERRETLGCQGLREKAAVGKRAAERREDRGKRRSEAKGEWRQESRETSEQREEGTEGREENGERGEHREKSTGEAVASSDGEGKVSSKSACCWELECALVASSRACAHVVCLRSHKRKVA